jgi:GTPase SAR1 family protein
VVNPSSFSNVSDKWTREIAHYCPNAKVVLVGTKLDLRNDPLTLAKLAGVGATPITTAQGIAKAKSVFADFYIECSALTQYNLSNVFKEAVSLIVPERKEAMLRQKKIRCTIL